MLAPMAESADLQPWPRAGETWAPVLPWPREECPAGFYIHSYSTVPVGGRAGWAWGSPGFRFGDVVPHPRERAIAEAWEYRYGVVAGVHPPHPPGDEVDARMPGRFGPRPITIEQVGGDIVFARRADGTMVKVPARDLRRAFRRVEGEREIRELDEAALALQGPKWPPGYSGQIITDLDSTTKFAFSVNDDLNPFTNPEQIGRMPPADRLHDTPEACVAAAWAHYRANGGST